MVSAISGSSSAAALVQSQAQAAPQAAQAQSSRATAQDTVNISKAGQQLSKSAGDADRDGDSA